MLSYFVGLSYSCLFLLQEIEQVHKQDKFHMETLHEKQVKFISILRERRLRWSGHLECSSGAIRTAYDMQIEGKRG